MASSCQIALRLLRSAVENNYCGWPGMDIDPLFKDLRGDPEFQAIRTIGMECQRKFLEHRAARARSSPSPG